MLKISDEQMSVFQQSVRKTDKKLLREELSALFPALPDDELDSFIESGLIKTEKYGINESKPVKDFIRLMIGVAKDFDEYPPAKKQITRNDVNPNLTIKLMCELLTPIEWQEATQFGQRASDRNKEDYVQSFISSVLSA